MIRSFMAGMLGSVCVVGMFGCGSRTPVNADPELARETLRIALEAWKDGAPAESLPQRSPPIFFRDPDWDEGWKLKSFRTTLDDEEWGNQRRCYVHLTLQNANGKAAAKEVQYLVDTSPALVIVRNED